MLDETAHVLAALAERLPSASRPTRPCSARSLAIAEATPDAKALDAFAREPDPDPDDLAALDAAWEEEAVTFGPGEGGCQDDLAAKIRQGRRRRRASKRKSAPRANAPPTLDAVLRARTCATSSTTPLFGWYPYLCLTVFLLGSLLRFDREQYTWKTEFLSQLLRRRQLRWGSNLFHVGILVIFAGHFVGLLTPIWVFDALGVAHSAKQMLAIVAGGVAGPRCASSASSC